MTLKDGAYFNIAAWISGTWNFKTGACRIFGMRVSAAVLLGICGGGGARIGHMGVKKASGRKEG
jgi:hypothetical protein